MVDQLSITGKFLGTTETKFVGRDGTFAVRPFWIDITTNAEFPNTPEFSLKQDKVNLVDNIKKGDMVKVSFNIDGRKYENQQTGKKGVITNLVAWKIDVIRTQSAATLGSTGGHGPAVANTAQAGPAVASPSLPATRPVTPNGQPMASQFVNDDENNDLPF